LSGGYPEDILLKASAFLGQPHAHHRSRFTHYWADYESYRTVASICDLSAIWLWKSLERSRPDFIVEFGTGFSTFVILSYARYMFMSFGQRVEIVSLEHHSEWFERQSTNMSNLDTFTQVHLVHSSLDLMMILGQQVVSYSEVDRTLTKLNLGPKADFVFVDGPVGVVHGGAGRRGSILQSINLVREGGVILVHDALRSEEFMAIHEFSSIRSLGFSCRGIVPLRHGLAICEKVCKPESQSHD
jgi:predicted O-methyltransferase YrrM